MNTTIPLRQLAVTFCTLFVIGTTLTLPLYRFNFKKFFRSKLLVKIVFWIPIFAVFLLVLYAGNGVRLALLLALLLCASVEFVSVVRHRPDKSVLIIIFVLFVAGLLHFCLIEHRYPANFINLLIILCFATVLSDVAAFFCGNYVGNHKLPSWLNDHKSWEGVAGQFVGGFLGVVIVNTFITRVPTLWIFLPLGLGSAIGDLANSYVKRRANIKDWSNAIPGHGGFIDRLSSMSGSCMVVFYYLIISKVLA